MISPSKLLALCATLAAALTLSACGGGGGGSSNASSSGTSTTVPVSPPPALTNFAALTVDAGPASLATGPNGYISDNLAFVSVTLCAPGTNTCQTIDHVEVDTGSVGLRIAAGALSSAMLSALPHQSDGNSQPLGECFQFVDGYAFGSVRQANFQIGGETVAAMPFQVIGDSGAYANVPSSCSAGGGASLVTPQDLSANGIIGLGVTATDCGATCAIAGSQGPAIYYDCPSAGCGASVIEAAATSAPFQQLPNPVAAMAVDNNGVVISLPAAPQTGEASLTGTIYFGIGTQTNNGLGSATVLATTNSASDMGAGLVTATYNGQSLPDSFLDTGSNLYLFADNGIATCTDKTYNGYYCPTTPVQVSPTIATAAGGSVSAAFTLNNAATLLATTNTSVLPGIGGNPAVQGLTNAYPTSFDFGLPFFYGRIVYTAIEGRTAGGIAGPFIAY